MILYALRHKKTGKMMSLSVVASYSDADFCNDVMAYISPSIYDPIWLTSSYEDAEEVANATIESYNSDIERPENSFYKDDFDIVEFKLSE